MTTEQLAELAPLAPVGIALAVALLILSGALLGGAIASAKVRRQVEQDHDFIRRIDAAKRDEVEGWAQ